jgi:hypothetical protein
LRNYISDVLKIKRYLVNEYQKTNLLTELEFNRIKQIINELKNLVGFAKMMTNPLANLRRIGMIQIRDTIEKIRHFSKNPVSFFPDINIWLMCNQQAIGICTIKSQDVIWSNNELKRGVICNKLIYIDFMVGVFY